jgi:hypothetical protein
VAPEAEAGGDSASGRLCPHVFESACVACRSTTSVILLPCRFWGDIEGTGNGPFPSGVNPPPTPNATTPRLRNVTIRNIVGVGSSGGGGIDCYMVGNLQCPPESGCTGLTLSNISLMGYKTWSCANVANVEVIGSVSPDPGLYGCLGNESVAAPAYHASNFQ